MEQFVLIPYSIYQSPSTLTRKQKLEQKQDKDEIVPKSFDTIYSDVNARLKTIYKKHLIDSNLISPRIKLSQSNIIMLDKRDTKESIVVFVCKLKRKKHRFHRYLLYCFGSNSISP